ncbi:MAG TPA: hypothetical protein VGK44_19575 [Casimicrobiaceae bacterium]
MAERGGRARSAGLSAGIHAFSPEPVYTDGRYRRHFYEVAPRYAADGFAVYWIVGESSHCVPVAAYGDGVEVR